MIVESHDIIGYLSIRPSTTHSFPGCIGKHTYLDMPCSLYDVLAAFFNWGEVFYTVQIKVSNQLTRTYFLLQHVDNI